jgi:hypothetical protein
MLPAETVFRDIVAVLPGSGVRVATDDDSSAYTDKPASEKKISQWTRSSSTSSVGESSIVTMSSSYRYRSNEPSSQPTSRTSFSLRRGPFSYTSRNKSNLVTTPSAKFSDRNGLTLLYAPAEPLIDLVFVHGLGGGSVTSWSKNDDHRNFWPQAWLPQEPSCQHARIHSFGYKSNWDESGENIVNIHGTNLLLELSNKTHLKTPAELPIILIGHSMGGLGESLISLSIAYCLFDLEVHRYRWVTKRILTSSAYISAG